MADRWKLVFEYDGTDFSGWQRQPNARTVEQEIEKAFSTLYQNDIDIIGQGRTDAGVHARGQVAHVDLPSKFTSNKIIHAMRGLLPKDIALLEAEVTQHDFHARFSATERSYSYSVLNRPSPLMRKRAWSCGYSLDQDQLEGMAEMVKHTRDFINFCIPDEDQLLTTESTINVSCWKMNNDVLTYTISANRFLRHMVRRLVGSMVQVASGRKPMALFEELLDGNQLTRKGHSAPARGLYLDSVSY
ncbi:tRNA pseudouridine(38-40) synthase TruA [Rhodohalobacter sp. 8-1]|uniref:tRNA pseudouridine(38-40) synthase TruA n=1 Tax=Rhodohalobacter sp. 8-1 TaxID=3131972 RepID=UPI0030EF0E34